MRSKYIHKRLQLALLIITQFKSQLLSKWYSFIFSLCGIVGLFTCESTLSFDVSDWIVTFALGIPLKGATPQQV